MQAECACENKLELCSAPWMKSWTLSVLRYNSCRHLPLFGPTLMTLSLQDRALKSKMPFSGSCTVPWKERLAGSLSRIELGLTMFDINEAWW